MKHHFPSKDARFRRVFPGAHYGSQSSWQHGPAGDEHFGCPRPVSPSAARAASHPRIGNELSFDHNRCEPVTIFWWRIGPGFEFGDVWR